MAIESSNGAEQRVQEMQRAAPSSANLPLVDEAAAGGEVGVLFEQYRERFGRADLPGILLCFATNPSLLRGTLEIAGGLLFADGLLTRRHKEMIATFVSLQNACPYCADSHGHFLRLQGASAELIGALETGNPDSPLLTEAERALLRFAGKVNANASAIRRSDIEAMMQAGWTEAQVSEAVHIAALFAAFNRIANSFGLPSPYSGFL